MKGTLVYKIVFWLVATTILAALIFSTLWAPTSPLIPTETAGSTIKTFQYIRIHDACNWAHVGTCVNIRSGPGTKYPVVEKLRDGVVLKVGGNIVVEGQMWYKVIFTSWLRYPERMPKNMYVAATDSVELFTDIGDQEVSHASTTTTKRIVVDVSEETLYAYDGADLFMQEPISAGLELTPTPHGNFFVFKKTPSRYMQGPIPEVSDQYYDLPGVPWNLYFTQGGAVIHGAYWHDKFGELWSHGCVNLPVDKAEKLYKWADVGMPVLVQE